MMRIKIPLTGEVTEYHPEFGGLTPSGGISGHLNNPVRPVPIDLGNVSWNLVNIDLENDLAEIEVTPSDRISIPTGKFEIIDTDEKDAEGKPIYQNSEICETRRTTDTEKQSFLDYARDLIESHTTDELYARSGTKRLVKSKETMKKYREKLSLQGTE